MSNSQSPGGTVRSLPDPYDADDALHIDEFPPYNGDRHAAFAFDDEGNRYKVFSRDFNALTEFFPEEKWRENVLPERDGVGEACAGCGRTIEWDAIIVNSAYHLRCYVDEAAERSDGGAIP
jgi:hypothetical protein